MWLIDKIAEQRIIEAGRKGAFDNLPDAGKPLHIEDDSQIPASLRVGFRLLKNAGYLPLELQLRKEIVSVQQLLTTLDPQDNAAVEAVQKRLNFLLSKMNMNSSGSVAMEEAYYEKLKNVANQRAVRSVR
jgi:hypothetical protein